MQRGAKAWRVRHPTARVRISSTTSTLFQFIKFNRCYICYLIVKRTNKNKKRPDRSILKRESAEGRISIAPMNPCSRKTNDLSFISSERRCQAQFPNCLKNKSLHSRRKVKKGTNGFNHRDQYYWANISNNCLNNFTANSCKNIHWPSIWCQEFYCYLHCD